MRNVLSSFLERGISSSNDRPLGELYVRAAPIEDQPVKENDASLKQHAVSMFGMRTPLGLVCGVS